MKATFKKFFTSTIPAMAKKVPGLVKNIPAAAKTAWNWGAKFVMETFPEIIKSACRSIMALINGPAIVPTPVK